MRTFIAINLPVDIKHYLMDLIDDLKRKNPLSSIKWVEEENLHLTLFFLGELNEDQLLSLVKKLKEVVNFSKFLLTLEKIGAFPNKQRPRVLKVDLKRSDNLNTIIEAIQKIIKSLNLPIIDKKPFNSHITLGRIKSLSKINGLDKTIKNLSFEVKSIDLMSSELFEFGPRYSIIKSYNLN